MNTKDVCFIHCGLYYKIKVKGNENGKLNLSAMQVQINLENVSPIYMKHESFLTMLQTFMCIGIITLNDKSTLRWDNYLNII